ncbi:hypothetical protein Daus18300_002435 [Diaporthe australafricana]|uniref:Rhodopsin domain-containing protein n=1 Tax=Diaporthe australafricana TaxID=127596 RepID=A0ABR3XN93_9PEZI
MLIKPSVVAVSLYRLTTIDEFTLSHNPTSDFVEVGIWSGLELDVGIICACLPNFHSLLKPVYAWMGTRTWHSDSGRSGRKHHRRLHDVEQSGPDQMIRATTVVVVKEQGTKGAFSDSSDRGTVQEIELGGSVNGTTGGRAWS